MGVTNLYTGRATSAARNDRFIEGVDDCRDEHFVLAVQSSCFTRGNAENNVMDGPSEKQGNSDHERQSGSPYVAVASQGNCSQRKANENGHPRRPFGEKTNRCDACHRIGVGRNNEPGIGDRNAVVVEKNALLCAHGTGLSEGRVACYCPTWSVRMEVPGLLWWPTWEGRAACAQNAATLAVADFHAQWGGVPVRVTSVCEVRA